MKSAWEERPVKVVGDSLATIMALGTGIVAIYYGAFERDYAFSTFLFTWAIWMKP
jgi:hypothetical protein